MERKDLEEFYKNNRKVKVNTNNGRFFTECILKLEDNYLLLLDKFNNKIPIDFDAISFVVPCADI